MPEIHPEVVGMKSGTKQLWLRTHREDVLVYFRTNGEDATIAYYNMSPGTLSRLLDDIPTTKRYAELAPVARALEKSQYAVDMASAANSRLKAMEREIERFQPVVEVVEAVLTGLENIRGRGQGKRLLE